MPKMPLLGKVTEVSLKELRCDRGFGAPCCSRRRSEMDPYLESHRLGAPVEIL